MNGFDFGALMRQAQEHAARVQQDMDRKLSEQLVEGRAGGGAVKIHMTANLDLQRVEIAPEVFKEGDKAMLEDLILAAFKQALKSARELQGRAQQKQIDGLAGGLPGLGGPGGIDISKMFGG